MMWSTLLVIDNVSKKQFDLINKNNERSYIRQLVTSSLIASGLVLWGLPIDFVKTRIQMEPELQKMKRIAAIQVLFRRYGRAGFYSEALPVFVHTVFHATLGGYMLNQIFALWV